jgi:hypothetical protein
MMRSTAYPSLLAIGPDLPDIAKAPIGGPGSGETVAVVLMSILAVVLVVVLWAVFIRKPARAGERGRLVESRKKGEDESSSDSGRRRRRRRERRGSNPTLAQTGGLPPPRYDDSRPPTP